VALFGFGQLGQQMAAILQRRAGVEIVAAISPSRAGRPANLVVPGLRDGLVVAGDPETALTEARAEVVLHATAPRLGEVMDQLLLAIRRRCHVISSCEELAFPWSAHPQEARTLERESTAHGVGVLGTGVNPGYVFDALVLEALSARRYPTVIAVSRVTDASGFGSAVRGRLGLGLAVQAFEDMVRVNKIAGHVGFRESMDLIAAAMGTRVHTFQESMAPLVADRDEAGVHAGLSAGFIQQAIGTCEGGPRLDFKLSLHLWPRLVGIDVIDVITVEDEGGVHELRAFPASSPVEVAAAQLVNAIPLVLAAPPGLRTRLDVGRPVPWVQFPKMTPCA
jgi:4-hydroxy-tetrahydrodipicolinate reductase